MTTLDLQKGTFLVDPKAKDLLEENRAKLQVRRWIFNIGIDGCPAIGYLFEPIKELDRFLLHAIDFRGKRVLNIGCKEGFFSFLPEALGAAEVLAIDDQPKLKSSAESFALLQKLFDSKVQYKNLQESEMYAGIEGQFDIVLISDSLTYFRDPQRLLAFAAERCKGVVWLFTYVALDNTNIPSSVLLRNYSPEPAYTPKHAFNFDWLIHAADQNGLTPAQVQLHQNGKYLSMLLKPGAGITNIKKISYEEMPTDENRQDETAILVMSCKKFEQLWDPFFILFKRYWPDCPYKIYFCTDTGRYPGVETIEIGKDLGWASNCRHALEKMSGSRFILFQEDFFLNAPVDSLRVSKYVEHAHIHDAACLRFSPVPGASEKWLGTDELGVIRPYDDYRLSMQIAMWKKKFFYDLIQDGENPWQIEIEGTKRAALRPELFLSTWKICPIPYYITAVEKGEWKEEALELLDREGIPRAHIRKKVY